MRVLDLEQGCQEWLDLRKEKVTATDIAKIMNVSPWGNAVELWKEKIGLIEKENFKSEAMMRGNYYEDEAREKIKDETFIEFKPAVIMSEDYPWLLASLDGLNEEKDSFCEIKTPMPHNFKRHCIDSIPLHYMLQMQTAFALSLNKIEKGYFCIYSPELKEIYIRDVFPDSEMINEILEKSHQFYRQMREFEQPAPIHKLVETDDMALAVDKYKLACDMSIKAEEMKKEAREEIVNISGGDSIQGHGVKLTRYWTKGSVDYKKIPELQNIDLDKYRKQGKEQIRLSISK